MRNLLKIAAWISGIIGLVLIVLGVVAVLSGGGLFGHFWTNLFYPSNNFILLGIFFFLAILVGKRDKI